MGTVKRTLRALSVLWLAPLGGVSCGNSSQAEVVPSTGGTGGTVVVEVAYSFQALKPVTLLDRGQFCATMAVGGLIAYRNCYQEFAFPELVYTDPNSHLFMLAILDGDKVAFPDGNVRVLATSEHWVTGQMDTEMSFGQLRFKLTSDHGTRHCAVSGQLAMFCQ
jgi:hypothetical protein